MLGALAARLRRTKAGRLAEFPSIEWYIHSTVDPSIRDSEGHHNSALFVEWVPEQLAGHHLGEGGGALREAPLLVCDRFAPGTSDLVQEYFTLTPPKSSSTSASPAATSTTWTTSSASTSGCPTRRRWTGCFCSAGCHPAGSVIGAAGHNAAKVVLQASPLRPPSETPSTRASHGLRAPTC